MAQKLHRGRLIDHLGLVVRDLAASKAFYSAAAGALGLELVTMSPDDFYIDELFVSSTASRVVLDPDGNNIEAVHHGPHERSAASVELTF